MIYFAQLPTGAIKIGCSADVPARIAQLEAHYGQGLALLHVERGGREEESAWHARFAYARLGRTEQFRPAPDLMLAIGRPLLVTADPDAVEVVEPVDRVPVVSIKGTAEFRDWLYELADHERMTAVQLLERAVVEHARSIGYEKPAPKRTK